MKQSRDGAVICFQRLLCCARRCAAWQQVEWQLAQVAVDCRGNLAVCGGRGSWTAAQLYDYVRRGAERAAAC